MTSKKKEKKLTFLNHLLALDNVFSTKSEEQEVNLVWPNLFLIFACPSSVYTAVVNRARWGPRSSERHPWCTRKCPRLTQRYKPLTWTDVFKGILSTSCVIFSYPKLLSISVLTFIKWRLTPSYVAKDTIFWQKRTKTIVIRIIVRMTIFKSIHMAFYANTSWACALFRNNKQHVVLGQKRNCQRVEESGLWRIQR